MSRAPNEPNASAAPDPRDAPTARELADLCRDALARAGEPEAEAWARVRTRGFARFSGSNLDQHGELVEPSVRVRVARGSRVSEASTSRLDVPSIAALVAETATRARHVPETPGFSGFADASESEAARPPRFVDATAREDAASRVARLQPVFARIASAGLLGAGALETATTAECVVTTGGLSRVHDGTLAAFKVWALETRGAGGPSGHDEQIHRDVDALDPEGGTARAIEACAMGRNPRALPAGHYDVVLEPAAMAELLEWLSSIAFGAVEVEQGTSPLAGRLGGIITGAGVHLTEDPLDPGEFGLACPVDGEGVARRRIELVTGGVARGFLDDRASAARSGRARFSTGSRTVDFGSEGRISAVALQLGAGTVDGVPELIAGMERGLYVRRLHYVNGLLEPRRAVMTGLTRDGCFLVEKGKIVGPVGNLRFTDSLLEGLARCDGMTAARRAVAMAWSDGGVIVTPAVRMRAFRFNGGSQPSLTDPG